MTTNRLESNWQPLPVDLCHRANRFDILAGVSPSTSFAWGRLETQRERGESPVPTAVKEKPVVTKKEIVRSISEDLGLTQLKTKEIVQKVFDAILKTLVEEGRVELRNFGIFEVKRRGPRKARNPRTGEKVYVAERSVVTFKPGQIMQQRVRALTPDPT
jgi:nucleoid DNA-binding protein